jgi:hypothetical protein
MAGGKQQGWRIIQEGEAASLYLIRSGQVMVLKGSKIVDYPGCRGV